MVNCETHVHCYSKPNTGGGSMVLSINLFRGSKKDFGLRKFQMLLGKSFQIQECLKTQSGEESSLSGCFNPDNPSNTPESKRIFPATVV